MKVETNANISFPMQNDPQSHAPKSKIDMTPRQDEMMVSSDYQQYMSVSNTKSTASQAKIEALAEQLRKDTSFSQDKHRFFMNHPVGRSLATEMILADEGLQEKVAKHMWKTYADYSLYDHLPANWQAIDVKAMLMSSDKMTVNEVLSSYEGVLLNKARTVGLTDTEKLLSGKLEDTSFGATSTFDQKMDHIFDKVRAEFEACGMTFDESKSYAFYLDTSVFRFSVTGGTDEENALIEKVINTSNYIEDNFLATLGAIYNHRHEDGSYNPWIVDELQTKDAVPVFGVTAVSTEYDQKMKQLFEAYNRCTMEEHLRKYYGFGLDDIEYKNGVIRGKTEEVQEIIDGKQDFMKLTGYAYITIMREYTGTPEFSEAIFTYENGKFQTTYQTFEDDSVEGVTNTSALIKRAEQELAEKADVLEKGRDGVLARRSSGLQTKEELFQKLTQKNPLGVEPGQRFWNDPIGRELAKHIILSSSELMAQISEGMMKRFSGALGKGDRLFLPMDYMGFDIRAILQGSDEAAIDHVLMNYALVLGEKARTTGLSEMERYLRNYG